jgi:uncharacterized membrane protein
MHKGRLEAFSDGVLAIIITIMVLSLNAPQGVKLSVLRPLIPDLLSYTLSFIFIGIYWNNHHHLLQAATHVTGKILWANLHLLFWLTLFPFVTSWMGKNRFAEAPVALYGGVMFCAAVAYYLLTLSLVSIHEKDSALAVSIGNDRKGKISLVLYVSAILLAFVEPLLSCAIYVLVAGIWLLPEPRIEKVIT